MISPDGSSPHLIGEGGSRLGLAAQRQTGTTSLSSGSIGTPSAGALLWGSTVESGLNGATLTPGSGLTMALLSNYWGDSTPFGSGTFGKSTLPEIALIFPAGISVSISANHGQRFRTC